MQIICFCAGSLIALWLLQPLMCRWFRSHDTKTGIEALIGRHVRVTSPISREQPGQVAVDGDVWRAITTDGTPLEAGTLVRITGHQSVTLEVEPLA